MSALKIFKVPPTLHIVRYKPNNILYDPNKMLWWKSHAILKTVLSGTCAQWIFDIACCQSGRYFCTRLITWNLTYTLCILVLHGPPVWYCQVKLWYFRLNLHFNSQIILIFHSAYPAIYTYPYKFLCLYNQFVMDSLDIVISYTTDH